MRSFKSIELNRVQMSGCVYLWAAFVVVWFCVARVARIGCHSCLVISTLRIRVIIITIGGRKKEKVKKKGDFRMRRNRLPLSTVSAFEHIFSIASARNKSSKQNVCFYWIAIALRWKKKTNQTKKIEEFLLCCKASKKKRYVSWLTVNALLPPRNWTAYKVFATQQRLLQHSTSFVIETLQNFLRFFIFSGCGRYEFP